jgi:hypothetical protein
MPKAQQMPELVERDRLEIDAPGRPVRRHRPHKTRIEEHVSLDDGACRGIEEEAGDAQYLVEIRTIQEADRRAAIHHFRQRYGHALELEPHRCRADRRPGAGGARQRCAQIIR